MAHQQCISIVPGSVVELHKGKFYEGKFDCQKFD
jgi:hypothetical protein